MFQSLRQNSQVFIFHKNENPLLEIGFVTSISIPKPKYQIPALFGLAQQMVVDLVVKVNNLTINYNNLPAHLDIADTISNGDSIVIADSRDAMNSEILSYKQKSIDTINSIDIHKLIIAGCDKILNDLNPEYAQKQLQLAELNDLKSLVELMSKNMTSLMETNRLLVERLNRKDINNELSLGDKRG